LQHSITIFASGGVVGATHSGLIASKPQQG
jgi:hypothetical protein